MLGIERKNPKPTDWPVPSESAPETRENGSGLSIPDDADLTHHQKVRYDLEYVRHHPISRDMVILLKTVALVLSKKGAR